jgi:hypothetical protein
MTTTTIERLKVRAAERRTADAEAVVAAARSLAAGKELADVGALEAALAGAGMTVEDFDKLVALHRGRAADRKLLAARPAAAAAADKAVNTFTRVKAEAVAAMEAAEQQLARLEAQRAAAAAEVAAADAARERLIRGAPGLAGEKYREAVAAEVSAKEAVEAARRAVVDQREKARHHAWRATDETQHAGDIELHQQRVSRAEREAAEAEASIPDKERAVEAAKAARLRAEADAMEA